MTNLTKDFRGVSIKLKELSILLTGDPINDEEKWDNVIIASVDEPNNDEQLKMTAFIANLQRDGIYEPIPPRAELFNPIWTKKDRIKFKIQIIDKKEPPIIIGCLAKITGWALGKVEEALKSIIGGLFNIIINEPLEKFIKEISNGFKTVIGEANYEISIEKLLNEQNKIIEVVLDLIIPKDINIRGYCIGNDKNTIEKLVQKTGGKLEYIKPISSDVYQWKIKLAQSGTNNGKAIIEIKAI